MLPGPRAARYSGSDRPAWRMNHTGTWGTGWLRHARMKGASSNRPGAGAGPREARGAAVDMSGVYGGRDGPRERRGRPGARPGAGAYNRGFP